jgi:hypothetical protein
MKTASTSVVKWQNRASSASGDYADGAASTNKDQAQRAIAAKAVYQQALTESFGRDAYAKGLQASGKAGWLAGVQQKGTSNYATGVGSDLARNRYTTNSAKYDAARSSADSLPRGPKASQQNVNRVIAVIQAQRAVKIGK